LIHRGVTAGLPNKISNPRWHSVAESVRQLPICWIREDFLFWEICWNPDEIVAPERLDAVMALCISTGKKLMLNVVPCPYPTSEGWKKRLGGSWDTWMRPDFRLWEPIRESLQLAIDYFVKRWEAMNGQRNSLMFEWFNEPATGHVSGGSPDREAKGTWSKQFHSFCTFLLTGSEGIDFHGYPVVGPTLSFFGEGAAERQELATVSGGHHGQWWEKMHRRCVNVGIYLPKQARSPEEAAAMHRVELERILGIVSELPLALSSRHIRIHEWYVSKPMLGYKRGECDDSFRAECIHAIGESIASLKIVEAAFFFTHFFPPEQVKTPYDDHSAFSGPTRTAMMKFLKG
jgi:hypothetical protein